MSASGRQQQWIKTPRTNDVLFGRGSGPNDHEGNVFFRSLVRARKAEYLSTNHRQTKATIARDIVDTVRNRNGRFLRKADAKEAKKLGIPKDVDAWICADEKTIMEKAKQALRQKAESKDEEDSPKPDAQVASAAGISGDVLSPDSHQENQGILPGYAGQEHPPLGAPILPVPDSYISGELPSSQEPLDWRTYEENHAPVPDYMPPSVQQDPYIPSGQQIQPGQGFLSEEQPPVQRYRAEASYELVAEQNVHRAAAEGYAEHGIIGDGPEDDERRKSLQVEDLMRSFHRMGTDEMATSSSSNMQHDSTSNDTMGTIEPLPMGSSNVSMMSSSTFSVLKGALGESSTPRGSITRPGFKRDSTDGSASRKERSGSSDMSLSFSHLDAIWDNNSARTGNQFAQAAEGSTGDEACSQKISADPRPIHAMEDDPDSMNRFGQASISILKAALCDSGETLTSSSGKMSTDDDASKKAPPTH